MLEKTDFAPLIPHAGTMCLIDEVVSFDEHALHAIARLDDAGAHPLASARGLSAMHLIEYGAQAGAVHGALLAREHGATGPRPGRLVSVREVVLAAAWIDPTRGRLDIHAHCLYADIAGAQYHFRVEQRGRELIRGRAAVIHPDP